MNIDDLSPQLTEALDRSRATQRVSTDHPLFWFYERSRARGDSHEDLVEFLTSPAACYGLSPEQRSILNDGIAFLAQIFAGPLPAGHPIKLRRRDGEICGKVLDGRYLTPDDLAALPGGRLRFSLILERWTPPKDTGRAVNYPGVTIESRADGSIWTHRRVETGIGKVSDPDSLQLDCVEDAVRLFLHDLWGSDVHELPIDWGT